MKKIIQIVSDANGELNALTEDGKLYSLESRLIDVDGGLLTKKSELYWRKLNIKEK